MTNGFSTGYWGDPNQLIKIDKFYGYDRSSWGQTESIESLLGLVGNDGKVKPQKQTAKQQDEYFNKADAESEKLIQSLTDEQKQLLADLENGKFFRPSHLKEEH